HATDYTNASRTLLYNIVTKVWDEELLALFNIPTSILPVVKHSMENFGTVESIQSLAGVPIFAMAGDQQSALFGQRCFKAGQAKNTYGTGSFLVMNTANNYVRSSRLLSTLAVGLSGEPCYALEGSIFIAGAAIQWLRDELKIIGKASDSEAMAMSIPDNGGVYFVPAFVGYGAPYWNMHARGTLTGLTRGSNRNHIVRAALEAMAYQSLDVVCVMVEESGYEIACLHVDGGAVANEFLVQFQSDILNRPVYRPQNMESTSLGVAMMAGFKSGILSVDQLMSDSKGGGKTFSPKMDMSSRRSLIQGWHSALKQAFVI
ncbi:MAG: FGGY-family carbohydrate kinase, partial [Candidatus Margulisiibacteriota bacterium]